MRTQKRMDIVNGPLIPNIIRYIIPIIASAYLQVLYSAVDSVIVGQFDGPMALAAVGSTGALISLLVNACMGLAIGASVAVSQAYGAKDETGVHRVIHTSVLVSIIGGVLVGLIGFFFSRQFLIWMGSPEDVLPLATLYLKIYFLGTPGFMIYNFCASILRAVGDTKRPMFFLTFSGIVNVLLNLIFVVVFHMGVAGVAWATTISQYISMIMIVVYMLKLRDCCRLEIQKLKIYKDKLIRVLVIGLPAGIQSSVFAFSNVVIQSAVNSFDNAIVLAGNTAASQIENFIYTAMNSVYYAAMTFTGQNIGAGRLDNLHKVLRSCVYTVVVLGLVTGYAVLIFAEPLLGLYITDEPSAIAYGVERMRVVCGTYFMCGLMDVLVGAQRGMGASVAPMITSIVGACGLRILWVMTVFAAFPTLTTLYMAYPVTWTITAAVHLFFYFRTHKKTCKQFATASAVETAQ